MADEKLIPNCGLYRTSRALPGKEQAITAGRLIYFHNHSQKGAPLILLPANNAHNRWSFEERGYLVQDLSYCSTLTPLLPEGFYILKIPLRHGEKTVPARTLVQLGYNRAGEPIAFPAQQEENRIEFPSQGLRPRGDTFFKDLEPAGFVLLQTDESKVPSLH
jgi:hypothetical protein